MTNIPKDNDQRSADMSSNHNRDLETEQVFQELK